ncbi:MAG TPA: hypothetical protein VHD85_10620 [Terracidiphilus sp.]|nr:hypothetical protein [Terracidiphilus sp.]
MGCRLGLAGLLAAQAAVLACAADAALPDIRQLMHEVEAHQKQLEKVRENYTYNSLQTIQDVDSNGQVTKTQTEEYNDFFVNGHIIQRKVKKDGQPLSGNDEQKENERITKLVEKAQNTPPGQPVEGPAISISRLLEIMDVFNPRRVNYRGRPTIVFDFVGRKDAKTHGVVEDASKKLKGTVWIDETDRQVAHMEVTFYDNFRIMGGLFASVQKGSSIWFDQAPVQNGLWLPTGGEANMQARVLLLKNLRQHIVEKDYGFKQFHVEAEQSKEAAAPAAKP